MFSPTLVGRFFARDACGDAPDCAGYVGYINGIKLKESTKHAGLTGQSQISLTPARGFHRARTPARSTSKLALPLPSHLWIGLMVACNAARYHARSNLAVSRQYAKNLPLFQSAARIGIRKGNRRDVGAVERKADASLIDRDVSPGAERMSLPRELVRLQDTIGRAFLNMDRR